MSDGNHPLNNIGYQNLRMRLMTILRKLEIYLDLKIKEAKNESTESTDIKKSRNSDDTKKPKED